MYKSSGSGLVQTGGSKKLALFPFLARCRLAASTYSPLPTLKHPYHDHQHEECNQP